MAKDSTGKVILTPQEEKEMREGLSLYEMTQGPGWQIVKQWLIDRAHHTWADPRETAGIEDWQWRELNAFHASNNATELLAAIEMAIEKGDYLQKTKNGENSSGKMRI